MKRLIYGLACFLLILSCEIEGIPKSITVKGNPGLHVPLGSPFAGLEKGERLEDLISPSQIKEMMGADNGSEIYELSLEMAKTHGFDPNVQTYMLQYPLADMPLDMEKYINGAMDDVNAGGNIKIPFIPGIAGSLPEGQYIYINGSGGYIKGDNSTSNESTVILNPFLRIPLNDMAKLVEEVTGEFGLEINYTKELEDHLQLKIPAFGITTYKKGIPYPTDNPTKLQYYELSKTKFNPRPDLQTSGDNSELWVYARISGPCSGDLELKMIFDWEKAVINTDSDGFDSEYPIENNLDNFLGGGASFKKVEGYVYMSGLHSSDNVKMTVDIDGKKDTRNLKEATPNFSVTTKPDGTMIADGSLKESSFNGTSKTDPLNLTEILNGDGANLKVNIDFTTFDIEKEDIDKESRITFNLFVLIPLDLNVSEIPGKEAPDVTVGSVNLKKNYVPLDFGDLLKNNGDDLFGRKDGEDNLLNEIELVEITIKGINITIVEKDKLVVLVKSKNDYRLLEFNENASLKFDREFLSIPFSPEFNVLLKKDTGKDSGSLRILRSDNPKFDFRLELNAKANIEQTIKFNIF